ncbi:MAG TPA: kelch repeat-containing protein [Solirubrobacteraceae bacterium]
MLYAIGGDGGANSNAIGTVETFDPTAPGAWTNNVTTLPGQPLTGVAAATVAGQVHVLGGTRGGPVITPVTTHNIFDPATNAWAAGALLGTARAYHAAVTATDGAIYAIGGVDGLGNALSSVERLDPATHAWSAVASMPTARSGLAACAVGDMIYAIGGEDSNGAPLTTVEVFSRVTGTWNAATLPSLLHGRTKLAASAGPGGLIYAIGGLSSTSPATPAADVYSWNQSTASTWQTVSPSLASATGLLGAALGPDGRVYAVGGNTTVGNSAATRSAEVFTTAVAPPQPYIGNGTYQSPDIILTDPSGNTVMLGGQPSGPWDTQLAPNTNYGLSAHIHNDSGVAAPDTVVRFWSFPGGVGSAGTLLSEVVVSIPAGGTTVNSPAAFHSAGPGQHECAVVSLSDAQAPFINVDATSAAQVPDPTIAHPAASAHYASAWRNTDSMLVGAGMIWHLVFTAGTWLKEPLPLKVEVTTARVPVGFEEKGEAAKLRDDLRVLGVAPRAPLFLAPRVRAGLEPARELEVSVSVPERAEEFEALRDGEHRELKTSHREPAHFTVRGRIPDDAKPGEVFLLDIGAHHPAGEGRPPRTIRWLQVLYVTDRLIPHPGRDER